VILTPPFQFKLETPLDAIFLRFILEFYFEIEAFRWINRRRFTPYCQFERALITEAPGKRLEMGCDFLSSERRFELQLLFGVVLIRWWLVWHTREVTTAVPKTICWFARAEAMITRSVHVGGNQRQGTNIGFIRTDPKATLCTRFQLLGRSSPNII